MLIDFMVPTKKHTIIINPQIINKEPTTQTISTLNG